MESADTLADSGGDQFGRHRRSVAKSLAEFVEVVMVWKLGHGVISQRSGPGLLTAPDNSSGRHLKARWGRASKYRKFISAGELQFVPAAFAESAMLMRFL
jgi:hypothetical protein